MNYKEIVKAIYKKAMDDKQDVRPFIREWIMMMESSKVEGWDRMEFLDYCVAESKRVKYHNQVEKKRSAGYTGPSRNKKSMYVDNPDNQQDDSRACTSLATEDSVEPTCPADVIIKKKRKKK